MMGRRVERGNQNVARGRFWRRGGASEYSGVATGERCGRADGWTSRRRRRQFQQVFIGLRFLLGFTKEGSRKPVGSFSGAGQEGMWRDEEISAIEILGSLSSLGVSRR